MNEPTLIDLEGPPTSPQFHSNTDQGGHNQGIDDFLFFEQSQQSPDPPSYSNQPPPDTEFDPSLCDDYLAHLQRSSSLHETFLQARRRLEETITRANSQLWSFDVDTLTTSGICGDENQIVYRYNVRHANLNRENMSLLERAVADLHRLNFGPVFSSLFEVTIAELRVTHFLQSNRSKYFKNAQKTKDILSKLFRILADSQLPLSGQSVSIIRQLVLMMGSNLLGKSTTRKSSLIDLSDSNDTELDSREDAERVASFFLNQLFNSHSADWAASLLQIGSIEDVLSQNVLTSIFSPVIGTHYENEYLAILGQIPWYQMASRSEGEVKDKILIPIDAFLPRAVEKGFTKLVITLGRIVLLAACTFERLTLNCLFSLLRSPWPSPILISTLFLYFPWDQLDPLQIARFFMEWYHIGSPIVRIQDYLSLDEQQKDSYRVQMMLELLTSEQLRRTETVKKDMNEMGDVHSFPLLELMRKIGRVSSDKREHVTLQTMVGELFWYSMVAGSHGEEMLAHSGRSYDPTILPLLPDLATEAGKQLVQLVVHQPTLLSSVVQMIGANLARVDYHQIMSFFSSFKGWTPDLSSLNWMSFFLSRKTFPEVDDRSMRMSREDLWFDHYLRNAPSSVDPTVRVQELKMGLRLLQMMDLEHTDYNDRTALSIILLASKNADMNDYNMWNIMLDPKMGWNLVKLPLDRKFVTAVLNLPVTLSIPAPPHVPPFNKFIVLLQVQLTMSLLKEDIQKKTPRDNRWLSEMGFFEKIEFVLIHLTAVDPLPDLTSHLLFRLFSLFKPCAVQYASVFSKALVQVMRSTGKTNSVADSVLSSVSNLVGQGRKNQVAFEVISRVMTATLNKKKDHDLWIQLWTLVLADAIPSEQSFVQLMDMLVRSVFINQESLEPIVNHLHTKNMNKKDLDKMVSDNNVWIAYASLLTINPAYPSDSTSLFGVSTFGKNLKNSRLWIAKELAINVKDSLIALLFWEQFFSLYFEAVDHTPNLANRILDGSTKEQLTRTFTTLAQSNPNFARIYRIYYSFTTWSRDVIFGRSEGKLFNFPKDFSDEDRADELISQSLELFQHMSKIYPPTHTVGSDAGMDTERGVSSLPTNNNSVEEEPDTAVDVRALLPIPLDPPNSNSSYFQSFANFLSEVGRTMSSIPNVEGNQDLSHEGSDVLPIVDSLRTELQVYGEVSDGLLKMDRDFLHMIGTLYKNELRVTQVSVACYLGPHCKRPGLVRCDGNDIKEGSNSIKYELEDNRREFSMHFSHLFKIAKSLAKNLTVLKYIIKSIVQNDMRAIGIELFFSLTMLVLNGKIPSVPIAETISSTAYELGKTFVRDNSQVQERLMLLLLTSREGEVHSDLKTLISCFNPALFLPSHPDKYLELLNTLASGLCTLPAEQEKILAERFYAAESLGELKDGLRDDQVNQLLVNLPTMLTRPALHTVAHAILSTLMAKNFPTYLEAVVNIVISCSQSRGPAESWNYLLETIHFEDLDEPIARKILGILTSHLPMPPMYIPGIVQIARHIILDSPSIVTRIVDENSTLSEMAASPGFAFPISPVWNEIEAFLAACVECSVGPEIDDIITSIGSVGNLITEIVESVSPQLVDRLWVFYRVRIVRALAKVRSKEKHTTAAIFRNWFEALPWESASFHYRDVDAIKTMKRQLPHDPLTISTIFSRLNWTKYFTKIEGGIRRGKKGKNTEEMLLDLSIDEGPPTEDIDQDHAAYTFLQLYMMIHISNPHAIPSSLREQVTATGGQKQLYQWSSSGPSVFLEYFSGRVLSDAIRSSACLTDPSRALIQCCSLLYDVAMEMASPPVKAVVVTEARSLLFLTLRSKDYDTAVWHLPYNDRLSLLSTVIIPIARSCSEDSGVLPQCLIAVYSSLNESQKSTEVDYVKTGRDISFFNDTIQGDLPSLNNFMTKLTGLVLQFSASLSPKMALESLNIGPQAVTSSKDIIPLYEEILRSFLNNFEGYATNAVPFLIANFQNPLDISQAAFMTECRKSRAALTMIISMHQVLRNLSGNDWLNFVCQCIHEISKFEPDSSLHHECDVFALWFFVIHCVQHNQWKFDSDSAEALSAFESSLSDIARMNPLKSLLSAAKTKMPAIELAARATLVLLDRTISNLKLDTTFNLRKVSFDESIDFDREADKRFDSQLSKLLALKKDAQYQPFFNFFTQIESLFTSQTPTDLIKFRAVVLHNLAPIYVYLQKI